jgi:hypothetical protein
MFVIGIALIILKLVGAISCSWTVLLALIGAAVVAQWIWYVIQVGTVITAVRAPVRRTRRTRRRSRSGRLF